MKKRKKSIFEYILVPLLIVMIVQGIFSFITFQYSGTTKLVHENAVKILKQTAVNRKNLFENFLISNCADVSKERQELEDKLSAFLDEKGCTVKEFAENEKLQEEFLNQAASVVIAGLRGSKGTGAFLVLANGDDDAVQREGVYFRDLDSEQNPSDNTDLNLLRGRAEVGKLLNIPLDTLWTSSFEFTGLTPEQTAFYYNPVGLARENMNSSYKNLGYWSGAFCMDVDIHQDSHRQLTYSIPLIYQGVVYGVYGIELEVEYLAGRLPVKEIDDSGQGSYLLAHCREDGTAEIIMESGKLLAVSEMDNLKLLSTDYEGLYRIDGTKLYCMTGELNLYNRNSPFLADHPTLITVTTYEKLFGMGDSLAQRFILTVLVSLVFGFVCIYLISEHTTNPIRKMADFIKNNGESELRQFANTQVKELDELYDVICSLSEQQLKTQEELKEEKERYIIALESTTDIIFEYSLEGDILTEYTFNKTEKMRYGTGCVEERRIENVRLCLDEQRVLNRRDVNSLDNFLKGGAEYSSVCIGIGEREEEEEYRYYEFRGKTIYDAKGAPIKIIGSIRNVTEEMSRRKEEEFRKNYDRATGLLNLDYGRRQILGKEYIGRESQAILIDIRHFKSFNEKLGMTFGDMIIEELGDILKRHLETSDLAIRCGGDQFLMILMEATKEDALNCVEDIQRELKELRNRTGIDVPLGIGIAAYPIGRLEFEQMLKRVLICVKWTKRREDETPVIFEELSQQDKALPIRKKDQLREIMSMDYEKNVSLSKILYNAFDRAVETETIMPFLLGKICKKYHFTGAVVSMVDYDFYTNCLTYGWNSSGSRIEEKQVFKCSRDEFYEMIEMAEKDDFRKIGTDSGIMMRQFFFLPSDKEGICFPMLEDGCYVGEIIFISEPGNAGLEDDRLDKLEETVNVIRTNLSRKKLDLASRAKSEFLSRMSHEIRTPMNAILGMCNIAMQQEGISPKVQDCLGKIDTSSQYLLSLLNDILDMSRIESGKLTLELKAFHLGEMLDVIENLIRPQAEEKGLHFHVTRLLQDNILVGDSLRLNQILINLLGNAIKFTPQGGDIDCVVEQTVSKKDIICIDFMVKDNGIGISEEHQQKIFYPFEQAEESTAREFGGTGLGLSICKNLVQMMGGELRLNSSPGNGSEFTFSLQFAAADYEVKTSMEAPRDKVEDFDFSGKRILLVEDIALNIEIAKAILEVSHFVVEVAENGKEAIEMFETSEPGYYDVILMDVRMPVMDGLEATRRIRRMDKEDALSIPIIAMTANAFDEDMKKSIDSGMNGHLTKPIDVNKVYDMLNRIVNERKAGD